MPTVPSLPHTPPFRLIDRIVEYDSMGGYLVAEKQLTVGDELWPSGLSLSPFATFPQTLMIEALCQAAAAFNQLSAGEPTADSGAAVHRGYLVGASDLRFPNFVAIGETLRLCVKKQQAMGSLVSFLGEAFAISGKRDVAPRQVVSGRLLFSLMAA